MEYKEQIRQFDFTPVNGHFNQLTSEANALNFTEDGQAWSYGVYSNNYLTVPSVVVDSATFKEVHTTYLNNIRLSRDGKFVTALQPAKLKRPELSKDEGKYIGKVQVRRTDNWQCVYSMKMVHFSWFFESTFSRGGKYFVIDYQHHESRKGWVDHHKFVRMADWREVLDYTSNGKGELWGLPEFNPDDTQYLTTYNKKSSSISWIRLYTLDRKKSSKNSAKWKLTGEFQYPKWIDQYEFSHDGKQVFAFTPKQELITFTVNNGKLEKSHSLFFTEQLKPYFFSQDYEFKDGSFYNSKGEMVCYGAKRFSAFGYDGQVMACVTHSPTIKQESNTTYNARISVFNTSTQQELRSYIALSDGIHHIESVQSGTKFLVHTMKFGVFYLIDFPNPEQTPRASLPMTFEMDHFDRIEAPKGENKYQQAVKTVGMVDYVQERRDVKSRDSSPGPSSPRAVPQPTVTHVRRDKRTDEPLASLPRPVKTSPGMFQQRTAHAQSRTSQPVRRKGQPVQNLKVRGNRLANLQRQSQPLRANGVHQQGNPQVRIKGTKHRTSQSSQPQPQPQPVRTNGKGQHKPLVNVYNPPRANSDAFTNKHAPKKSEDEEYWTNYWTVTARLKLDELLITLRTEDNVVLSQQGTDHLYKTLNEMANFALKAPRPFDHESQVKAFTEEISKVVESERKAAMHKKHQEQWTHFWTVTVPESVDNTITDVENKFKIKFAPNVIDDIHQTMKDSANLALNSPPPFDHQALFDRFHDELCIRLEHEYEKLKSTTKPMSITEALKRSLNKISNGQFIDPDHVELGAVFYKGKNTVIRHGALHGKNVAVKEFPVGEMDQLSESLVNLSEVMKMAVLKSDSIISYLGHSYSETTGNFYVFMPYMPNTMAHHLYERRRQFQPYESHAMMMQVGAGLHCLHQNMFIYRGLEPSNILFDEKNWEVRLCDFGHVLMASKPEPRNSYACLNYTPPEELKPKPEYTVKGDIYDFGLIWWEMHARRTPYAGVKTKKQLATKICGRKERPKIPKDIPKGVAKLIKHCWASNPKSRPDAKQTTEQTVQAYHDTYGNGR